MWIVFQIGTGTKEKAHESARQGGYGRSHLVAAGILPDVVGGILPPRPPPNLQVAWQGERAIRRARMPGSTAGGDACRYSCAWRQCGGSRRGIEEEMTLRSGRRVL